MLELVGAAQLVELRAIAEEDHRAVEIAAVRGEPEELVTLAVAPLLH